MTTKEIVLDLIKDYPFTEEYKNDLVNKIQNSKFGFCEGHPTNNKYEVVKKMVENHIKENIIMEKEYRFDLDIDIDLYNFTYKLDEILRPYGIKLVIENNDESKVCVVKIENKKTNSETFGNLVDKLTIVNMKIWKYEDIKRESDDDHTIAEATRKTNILNSQRNDLIQQIDEILIDSSKGIINFKNYEQGGTKSYGK